MLRYKKLGLIKGIEVISKSHLTQLLFGDDVLMVGVAYLTEWRHYKNVMHIFFQASGMKGISENTSMLLSSGVVVDVEREITSLFNF